MDAIHLCDTLRQTGQETQLRDETDLRLVVTQNMGWRLEPLVATNIQIFINEDMLPWHEDVVIDNK